jgi:SAM-dependent methyltransferase
MSAPPMKPRAFVEEFARDLKPGRALDLACGDGRNAIWLADRGWRVTAVDRAPKIGDPRIEVHVVDIEKQEFTIEPGTWDLIVMSYYLQRDLFGPAWRGLAPGGVAIVIVHMFEPGHEQSRFSVHPGELRAAFPDAEVIAYREGRPSPDARAVAQIAIRRPLRIK